MKKKENKMIKFEDYNFGNDFKKAHVTNLNLPDETIKTILDWTKDPNRILLFSGNPGVGKTYLCAAMVRYFIEKGIFPRYFNEKGLQSKLRSTIETVDYEAELRRLCDSSHFYLDDIGSQVSTEWRDDIFFSFVDMRNSNRSPTIITSNLFLSELKERYDKRTLSRLMDSRNVIIELNWIDKRKDHKDSWN